VGDLLGVSEWVVATGFVATGLAIWIGLGFWGIRRAYNRVAARRPNPTEAEFLAMMAQDCSPEAAQFVWEQTLPYVTPRLTPHPDDLLIDDLCIDDDDIEVDWISDWADRKGLVASDLPDWPEVWPLTVRNFARWLDLARASAAG